ncbi:MAG: hypothetical protein OEZ06_32065 [Myxococcales bacterium]|nr:hypothetical protein [Myxococcales bacterium]
MLAQLKLVAIVLLSTSLMFVIVAAPRALAEPPECTFSPMDLSSDETDWEAEVFEILQCGQPLGEHNIPIWTVDYGTLGNEWDEGWGADDICNPDLPLARMLNTASLLSFASSTPNLNTRDFEGDFLQWAGNFTMLKTHETYPRCFHGDNAESGALASFRQSNNTMRLYLDFFYDASVVERASLLVHEARHRDKSHDSDGTCRAAGILAALEELDCENCSGSECTECDWLGFNASCDSSWEFKGANFYEIVWYWWFYADADRWTDDMRLRAKLHSGLPLVFNFDERPTEVVDGEERVIDVCCPVGFSCNDLDTVFSCD